MNRFSIIVLIVFLVPFLNAQDQIKGPTAFTLGIDVVDLFSSQNMTIGKSTGYRLAYINGITIWGNSDAGFNLPFEISYSRYYSYLKDVYYKYNTENGQDNLITEMEDQKYGLSVVEIGIGVNYSYRVAENYILSASFGCAIGIGSEWLTSNTTYRSVIDSSDNIFPTYMYGPHGEYNLGHYRTPYGIHLTVSMIWHNMIFEIRSKQVDYFTPPNYKSNSLMPLPRRVMFSIGYVL